MWPELRREMARRRMVEGHMKSIKEEGKEERRRRGDLTDAEHEPVLAERPLPIKGDRRT